MDTRNSTLTLVAVLVFSTALLYPALAGAFFSYSGDFNLPIPAPDQPEAKQGKGWMDDAIINVPDHLIIDDIDVEITLTHTSDFDLSIFLQNPAGTEICLNMYNPASEFFKGANYINTIFDDESHVYIKQAGPPFTGQFRPLEPYTLSEFDGQDAYGDWRLRIYDGYYFNTGTLNSFQIMITTPEPATVVLLMLGAACLIMLRPLRRR